jgi:hypothetical protein
MFDREFDREYVNEVTRIIKKSRPRRWGDNVVVLVSDRYHREAQEKMKEMHELIGVDTKAAKHFYVYGVLALPAPWLTDYEFEIRPKV